MTHRQWAWLCWSPCCHSGAPEAGGGCLCWQRKSRTQSHRWSATWRTILTLWDVTACQDKRQRSILSQKNTNQFFFRDTGMASFKIQVAKDRGETNIKKWFQKYWIMDYSFWDEIKLPNALLPKNFQILYACIVKQIEKLSWIPLKTPESENSLCFYCAIHQRYPV